MTTRRHPIATIHHRRRPAPPTRRSCRASRRAGHSAAVRHLALAELVLPCRRDRSARRATLLCVVHRADRRRRQTPPALAAARRLRVLRHHSPHHRLLCPFTPLVVAPRRPQPPLCDLPRAVRLLLCAPVLL